MDNAYMGQIVMFGGSYAPQNWELCNGQILPITEYSALYSILGTNYGGDGMSTFGLPDFRGRAPIGAGSGPALTPRAIGQIGGTETINLEGSKVNINKAVQEDGETVVDSIKDQSVSNMQPWSCVNFIICTNGAYPPRK